LIFDGLEIQREQSRWWYIRSFISPAQSGRALIELASLWFHDFSTNEVQSINDWLFAWVFCQNWSWYAVQNGKIWANNLLLLHSRIVSWLFHITSIFCFKSPHLFTFFMFHPHFLVFLAWKSLCFMGFSLNYMIFLPCSIHDNKLKLFLAHFSSHSTYYVFVILPSAPQNKILWLSLKGSNG